ncbi:threonine/homoserine/homoserine lactone efflux protein [Litorimonas taeanensis]|uniref:Threonine/homoserine/homoserine lactone efflux protein n=1 Tax=Litorimonas taeanensis TaxID=568099 RepID=A0A420WD19_9PROT|nr:LysE family translocator [Litorimonas taeanensis]RKQ68907.1 threonine/homoserine/homoserine lactone efflux protein [Litorimonas taeanensis]
MSVDVWLALVALFFVGGLTPGPAVMLVLASSFRYGFKPALLPAMGVASANVIWLLLAASGTAVLFELYPTAMFALKILGLVVLLWMGLSTMFGPLPSLDVNADDAPRRSRLYAKGVLLQITSPMPVVYFGMLLPQFFDADLALAPQFFTMLVTITLLEMFGLSVYAAGAQWIKRLLRGPKAARIFNVLIGIIMITSGAWAVFATT